MAMPRCTTLSPRSDWDECDCTPRGATALHSAWLHSSPLDTLAAPAPLRSRRSAPTHLVQTKSDVVPVKPVRVKFLVQEMLLESRGDGRLKPHRRRRQRCAVCGVRQSKAHLAHLVHLSAGGETGEPDRRSLLAEVLCSLVLRHGA
jgi:hypothetical protein